MSFEAERIAIEGRFKTTWDISYPAMTVGYNVQKFTPTAAGNSVRLTILDGAAEQVSMGDPGNNTVRHAGLISIQIFVPGGEGSATAGPIADAAMDIFRNATFSGVRCRVPYVASQREDPPFFVWTVNVPFQRDETNA